MKIDILTLFPEMFDCLNHSLLGKAQDKKLLEIGIHDIRQYSADKHGKCDDYTFGGGAGMLMTPQPLHDCINSIDPNHEALRIYLSPKGRVFCQQMTSQLAQYDYLMLVCGHYEGIDERVIQLDIDMELSIGDYVLTGGEIPAMVVVDAVSRYVDGVLHSGQSVVEESFCNGLLEYPQYTRPQEFCGLTVPEVLLSGNHKQIELWRKQQAEMITAKNRPDLLEKK